jgi:hypothetical protein
MTEGGYTEYYDIKPGDNPAVNVPDSLCDSDFVQNLLAIGDLAEEAAPAGAEDGDELSTLRDEALLLGIKVVKTWKADRIRAEIQKVNE